MKLPIVFIIIYLYLHCSGCEDLWSPRPRPIIVYKERPQNRFDKIQKTKDETLNLDCFADYPVRWLTPDNSMYHGYSNPKEKERLEINMSTPHNASLILSEIQWTDTGFYRCVSEDFDERMQVTEELAQWESRVYVYVNDSNENHLLLHLKEPKIFLSLDERSYIPCLATDTSATVELHAGSQKINYVSYQDGFGFHLQPGDLEKFCVESGNLFCSVACKAKSTDGRSDELSLVLRESPILLLPKNVEDMFYLNNTVTIECSSAFEKASCKLEDPKSRNITRSPTVLLSILNVEMSDEGTYKCTCVDLKSGKEVSKQKTFIVRRAKPEMVLHRYYAMVGLISAFILLGLVIICILACVKRRKNMRNRERHQSKLRRDGKVHSYLLKYEG